MKGKFFKLFVGLLASAGVVFVYANGDALYNYNDETKAAPVTGYPHKVGDYIKLSPDGKNQWDFYVAYIKNEQMYLVTNKGLKDTSVGTSYGRLDELEKEAKEHVAGSFATYQCDVNPTSDNLWCILYRALGDKFPEPRLATFEDYNDMIQGFIDMGIVADDAENKIVPEDFFKEESFESVGSYGRKYFDLKFVPGITTAELSQKDYWGTIYIGSSLIYKNGEGMSFYFDGLNSFYPVNDSSSPLAVRTVVYDNLDSRVLYPAKSHSLILTLPYEPQKTMTDIVFTPDDNAHVEGTASAAKGATIGTVNANPNDVFPVPIYTIGDGSDKFEINANNEVVIKADTLAKGSYTFTINAHQSAFETNAAVDLTSDTYTIVVSEYKKITNLTYTADNGKDPLYVEVNANPDKIGNVNPVYNNGAESGYGICYALTSTKGANDNHLFSISNNGELSINSALNDARDYHVEVTAYETDPANGNSDITGRTYTKVFTFTVLPKPTVPITAITFTPNYPSGKSQWYAGDPGINGDGELTGTFTFSGGSSPNYQTWEIVDASGNAVSNANFGIVNNELRAKKQIAVGTYALNVKVTDMQGETYRSTISISVQQAPNIDIDNNNKSQFYEFRLSNGSIADITKWQKENIIIHPKHPTYTQMKVDSGSYMNGDQTYTKEGTNTVTLQFQSVTGGLTNPINETLKIDKTKPTITVVYKDDNGIALTGNNPISQSIDIEVQGVDNESGLAQYQFVITPIKDDGSLDTANQIKQNTPTSSATFTYSLVKSGRYRVEVSVVDVAGNVSDGNTKQVVVDDEAPMVIGAKDQSEYKQYYLPRFVSVEDKLSGINQAYYTKDGGTQISVTGEIKLTDLGSYRIYAQDNAGNDITINFKIVPLPDMDQIDGSDESKDIIEQVEKELDEIKGKIDDTEKEDYEKWIEDAWDKWNSQRNKVVETDDKSAKVEGQGDTSFDPKVVLIVDDITDQEDDLPPLPRKAISIYDVYLQKGNARIQPDGSIKVYLPYAQASDSIGDAMGGASDTIDMSTDPIVYQIDTNNRVTKIDCVQEGNHVTFVTNRLLKYAISNEKQEVTNNDTCVVGSDGVEASGDEVCGKPNDKGDQPQKQPDGSVEVPEGGKVEFPNGSEIDTPDGATILPDGTVVLPDGTEYDPDGNKKGDKTCKLEGKDINIDTDGDGIPDINLDIDHDCKPELNIDVDGDQIPDIDIDTDGDGKPDINVDTNKDGKPNVNIVLKLTWKPNVTYIVDGFTYNSMNNLKADLNNDDNGDGTPDRNIDTDGDGLPDYNVDDDWWSKHGYTSAQKPNTNIGGAITGDNHKWQWWLVAFVITSLTMIYTLVKGRKDQKL